MKTQRPIFVYRMAGVEQDLDSDSFFWDRSLEGKEGRGTGPSLGQFFEAASTFIARDEYLGVGKGLDFYGQVQDRAALTKITITMEKHGALYHPARVEVLLDSGETFPLVLNTAVSSHAIRVLDNEVASLKRLEWEIPAVELPRVFAAGRVQSDSGELSFFLAQWFDGYLEFHIPAPPGNDSAEGDSSGDKEKESQGLTLWANDGGVIYLGSPDYFDIYGQAAEILTRLYNVETFEQVFPWHHAAGDFVVKPLDRGFDVRLITVRNYDSMFGAGIEGAELEIEEIYRALLFFFVNLSLRARLDRMDGIGSFCLVEEGVVPHIVRGFLRGLESKEICGMIGSCLSQSFLDFASGFQISDFAEILELTLAASNQDAPEMDLLKKNLVYHSALLASSLGKMG